MFGPGFRKEIGKPHKYLRKKHFRQKGEQIQRWEPSWQAQRTANEILNAVTVADDMRVRVLQTEARKDKVQETEDVVGLVGTPTPKLLCCVRSELDSIDITGGFSANKWCVFTYVLEESCSLLYWQRDKRAMEEAKSPVQRQFQWKHFPTLLINKLFGIKKNNYDPYIIICSGLHYLRCSPQKIHPHPTPWNLCLLLSLERGSL